MGSGNATTDVAPLHRGMGRLVTLVRRRRSAFLIAGTLLSGGIVSYVAAVSFSADAKATVRLEQCANLGTVCDTANPAQWQTGNLNVNNSTYRESDSIPYRSVITDLTPGATYSLTIEWDTTKAGKHAIDYITSFDRTVSTADPCAGETCGAKSTLAISDDPNVTGAGIIPVAGSVFTAYGATFPSAGETVANVGNLCGSASCTIPSNPGPYTVMGSYASEGEARITLYFTTISTSAVIAWGGHIADGLDWGVGTSAIDIPGSPYHMRLVDFGCSDTTNCSSGNEDRSLSSDAVNVTTTTSTTTSTSTTTTSTTTTSTTTTTEPEPTTTTVEATTTTAAPTTTAAASTTTFVIAATTVPPSTSAPTTSTSTTVAATVTVPATQPPVTTTSTTAPATTTTTAAPEPQNIVLPSTTAVPIDNDFLVLYPKTLPKTGRNVNPILLSLAILLIAAGAVIGFLNVRSNGSMAGGSSDGESGDGRKM